MSGPRKRVPRHLRETLFQRSGGSCERCARAISLDTFHVAHLRAHTNDGPAIEQNLEAWCQPCNFHQGSRDVTDTRSKPRLWQEEALPLILGPLADSHSRVATLSAAPGAGKTIFAGLVFEALRELDLIDRMVVLVPRLTLVDQWVDALRDHRHLELKPGHELERAGQVGVVNTYQSLNPNTIGVHRRQAQLARTLLVLDEVHHVGEHPPNKPQSAWSRNIRSLAGEVDVELNVAAVLNMSGTLWRSNADERISTVRYRPLANGRLEMQADFPIGTERLIRELELRPIDLYTIDGRVEMFDLRERTSISGGFSDLDEPEVRAALRQLAAESAWREAFVRRVLERLRRAHEALDKTVPVKALIVAARQRDAEILQGEVNGQMRDMGLRPFAELAISDDRRAVSTLERFRHSPDVGVLCTVDMAGEGYDCKEIAVVGYASNKATRIYVLQTVARGMRPTIFERTRTRVLPLSVVVPDVQLLIDTLSNYLADYSPDVIGLREPPASNNSTESGESPGVPREPRYLIESLTPGHDHVTVPLEGEKFTFTSSEVAAAGSVLSKFSLPEPMHPRVLAAYEQLRNERTAADPFDVRWGEQQSASRTPMSREQEALTKTDKLHTLEGWWQKNGPDDGRGTAQWLAYQANECAGIRRGGRPDASVEQLEKAVTFERNTIVGYCERKGLKPPRGLRNDDA